MYDRLKLFGFRKDMNQVPLTSEGSQKFSPEGRTLIEQVSSPCNQVPFPWSFHSILSQGPEGLTAFLEILLRSELTRLCQKHHIH